MTRFRKFQSFFFLVTLSSSLFLSVVSMEGDLFLSPMIKKGELDKAKGAAQDNLKLAQVKTASNTQVLSYSGFITINEEYNSNLFFAYVPALENPATAPLIIHINEFYGVSVMRNLFAGSGPFIVGENGVLIDNPHTWAKKYSILYVDAPVGTGFSFTDNKKGEAKNDDEEALEVVAALTQIFTLFPELKTRDIYLAADDYGCVFATNLVEVLESNPGGLKVNVKGLLLGSPLIEETQFNIADYFFYLGLFDEAQRNQIKKNEDKIWELVQQNKLPEASNLHFLTRIDINSLFRNFTGFSSFRHAVYSVDHPSYTRFEDFVKTKELHNYLHIGLHKFVNMDFKMFYDLEGAWLVGKTKRMESILAKGTYKVLVYASQFDLVMPHLETAKVLHKLQWPGAKTFASAPRTIWKTKGDVSGYVKSGAGLTYAVLRNAGSIPSINKPDSVVQLVHHLIGGEKL